MRRLAIVALLLLSLAAPRAWAAQDTATQAFTLTVAPHGVPLTWTASITPAQYVAGYNVYRGTTPGGENLATPINSSVVTADAYLDINVTAGVTYYYVVETVGVSGQQSVPSNEATATVPSP
jgi:hypothetical protein